MRLLDYAHHHYARRSVGAIAEPDEGSSDVPRRRPMPCLESSLYGYEWQQRSKRYLALHPECVVCAEPASVVDHIVPHRRDLALSWDEDNWQSLCTSDHNRKSASVDA